MLNAEKYRKEILNNYSKGFSIIDSHIDDCESIACESCLFSNSKNDDGYLTCINRKVKWLLSEYKEPVKLTKLEYNILTYILKNTECRYIARNESRFLCVHSYKPVKDTKYGHWTAVCDKVKSCEVFNDLFPFIKWEDEEPTLIKEVLNNCEVIEDD